MPQKILTSNYEIWPLDGASTLVCDGQIVSQIVDEFGVAVRLKKVFKPSFNEYGDANKTYTYKYSKAYVQTFRFDDNEVLEGIFKNGEVLFTFKLEDEDWVKTGNRIIYDRQEWLITEVSYQIISGIKYLIQARVENAQFT